MDDVTLDPKEEPDATDRVLTRELQGARDDLSGHHQARIELAMQRLKSQLFKGEEQPTLGGRYEVRGGLGVGGLGVVYEAFDRQLERPVAVKLLRHASGRGLGARMVREAKLLARVRHANVVRIYDAGVLQDGEGGVFIVMERLDGVTLRQWLEATPRTWSQIVRVFLQAGRGLSAAHDAGLVHRDFKPDNVLIDADGVARVLDFGLAAEAPEDSSADDPPPEPPTRDEDSGPATPADSVVSGPDGSRLTKDGTVLGTPNYMAPEQRRNAGAANAKSDQYSYCVSLAEALGLPLFEERPGAHPRPKGLVPAGVRKVVARGLRPRPDARWPDMTALLVSLRRAARRPAFMGASVLGASVLGLTAALAWNGPQLTPRAMTQCRQADVELADAWAEDTRASVEQTIRGLEVPWAGWTANATLTALDAYADRWRNARRAHCLQPVDAQSRVRGYCIESARQALAATTAILSRSDEKVLSRAIRVVDGLPAPERCLSAPLAELQDAAFRDDPTGEHDLRARVEKIEALRRAGRYDEGTVEAEALLAWADEHDRTGTRATALLNLGALAGRRSEFEKMGSFLDRAHTAAVAAGLDSLAVDALILRVGDPLLSEDEARKAETLATAWMDRTGGTELQRAKFHAQLGFASLQKSDFDQAESHLKESVRLFDLTPGGDAVESLLPLMNLTSVALLREDAPTPEVVAEVTEVATRHERVLGPTHPLTLSARANIGFLQAAQGNYAAAADIFEAVLVVYPKGGKRSAIAYNLAQLRLTLGEVRKAEAALRPFVAETGWPGPNGSAPRVSAMKDVAFAAQVVGMTGSIDSFSGRHGRARQIFAGLLEELLDPNVKIPPGSTPSPRRLRLLLAWESISLGDWEATKRHLAAAEDPTSDEAEMNAGGITSARFIAALIAAHEGRRKDALRLTAEGAGRLEALLRIDRARHLRAMLVETLEPDERAAARAETDPWLATTRQEVRGDDLRSFAAWMTRVASR